MFRNVIFIVFAGFIVLITTSYFFFKDKTSEIPLEFQNLGSNLKTISINGLWMIVETADKPDEQSLGLSYRESMPEHRGMLFIFPEPLITSFWMKDMQFALDILWIDESGTVIGIEKNVSPNTYPQTFSPPSPIKYVLEVNAGWSDRNKIKIGDKITGF